MGKSIGILGAGSWGITISILLEKAGNGSMLWEPLKENCTLINRERENRLYFPGIKIPSSSSVTDSLKTACKDSDLLIISVRSLHFRKTIKKLKKHYSGQPLVIATKGLEINTGKRLSEILTEELGTKTNFGVLSGPTIAREVAEGKPSAAVIGTKNLKLAEFFQSMFRSENIRIYSNSDITGIEIGGSFKNVLAIGSGIIDGLNLGINAKSSYLTRGLNEMIKIGTALGAKSKTFRGLSGIGDLITTSFSSESRNRSFGEALIKSQLNGLSEDSDKPVIEGIPATKAFAALCRRKGIDAPITDSIYNIVYKTRDPLTEIRKLMNRELKPE